MPNTNTTETENHTSATVDSLKDLDKSTVELGSYKGRPMLNFNQQSRYPFSFGILKLAIFVKFMKQINRFVETGGKSID